MSESYSATNLIINNIPSSVTDDQISSLFNKFGSIKSWKIIRHNDKEGKVFGFCDFVDSKSAKNAVNILDHHKLNDRYIRVSYAKLFPKPKGKTIEVSNIPKHIQEDEVRTIFNQFGKIIRMRLINTTNPNNNGRIQFKTAEIVYESKSEAEKASSNSQMKFTIESGKSVNLSVSLISQERDNIDENNKVGYYRDFFHFSQKNLMSQLGEENMNNGNYFYLNHPAIVSASQLVGPPLGNNINTTNNRQHVQHLQHPSMYNHTNPTGPYDLTALQNLIGPNITSNHQHPHAQNINAIYQTGSTPNHTLALGSIPSTNFYPAVATATPHYYFSLPNTNPIHQYQQPNNTNNSTSNTNNTNNNNSSVITSTANHLSSATPYDTMNSTGLALQQHHNNVAGISPAGYYNTYNSHPSLYNTHIPAPHQAPFIYGQIHPTATLLQPQHTTVQYNNNNAATLLFPPSHESPVTGSLKPQYQQIQHPSRPQTVIPTTNVASSSLNMNNNNMNHNNYYNRNINANNNNNNINGNNYIVYVYNIGNSTNKEQLRELFSGSNTNSSSNHSTTIGSGNKYSKDIIKIDIPKDVHNGSNKNFGFITFNNLRSAQMAIEEMNGKDYQGKLLQVSFKK